MDTALTHGAYVGCWAERLYIGRVATSTIESNRISEESNNVTIPCADSGALTRLLASVWRLTNNETTSGTMPSRKRRYRSLTSVVCFGSGLALCNTCSEQHNCAQLL